MYIYIYIIFISCYSLNNLPLWHLFLAVSGFLFSYGIGDQCWGEEDGAASDAKSALWLFEAPLSGHQDRTENCSGETLSLTVGRAETAAVGDETGNP